MGSPRFEVFLSHNSADKPAVEYLAERLREQGLEPWLDKWQLVPGAVWQDGLAEGLTASRSCAVFVGLGGWGPWQKEEMQAAIERRVRDTAGGFRVIPVLLPGAQQPRDAQLPMFLQAATWVAFTDSLDDPQAMHRLVCGVRGVPPDRGPGAQPAGGECPYRGLLYFDEPHAPFFFGRAALTDRLVEQLEQSLAADLRFLAVLGPSGSGKSSLARAGLLPALRAGRIDGSQHWPVVVRRPGEDPLKKLAAELSTLPDANPRCPPVHEILACLRHDAQGLDLMVRTLLSGQPEERRLVLLMDQFEEVFTLCADPALRRRTIESLVYAARIAGGQTVVLLAMRADFYGKCAEYADLAAILPQSQWLVTPMNDDELREAIERPARRGGCDFEPGLVDVLLRDMHSQPGALPLLEDALAALWHRRTGPKLTHAAYREIGKLEGALEQRANEVFDKFPAADRQLCQRVFVRLTQLGEGTDDTKRRVPLAELVPADGDGQAVERVVRRLADQRLVTTGTDEDPSQAVVEIAHEALIRGWSRLRQWIDEDRARLRLQQSVTRAAREWQENDRDKSFLFRGLQLERAEGLLDEQPEHLSTLEQQFLQAGRVIGLVEALPAVETEQLRELLDRLEPLAGAAQPYLQKAWAGAEEGSRARKHAALALVRLGTGELPFLKHSPIPDERTWYIHHLGKSGVDAKVLLRCLKAAADVSVRRALLLALGELANERDATPEAEGLFETLLELYRGDSDPGVHSAAEWALRQWGHHEAARTAIAELVADRPADGFHWHVTPGGHTMSLLRVELSATGTSGTGGAGATVQTVGVAATPVTVEQFQRFHPEHNYDESASPQPRCPVNSVTWYDAVAYCNWLSQCEAIPQDQWCYLPNDAGEHAAGMVIPPDALERTGYRLPTEREWEYACRAGAKTEYCFGNAEEMLPGYACYNENSGGRMFEVGSLKPNDFGLFDMHGNTWEWCQSRRDLPQGDAENDHQSENVSDSDGRVLRGGSFDSLRRTVRCAGRSSNPPTNRRFDRGFRAARTYP